MSIRLQSGFPGTSPSKAQVIDPIMAQLENTEPVQLRTKAGITQRNSKTLDRQNYIIKYHVPHGTNNQTSLSRARVMSLHTSNRQLLASPSTAQVTQVELPIFSLEAPRLKTTTI